MRHLHLQEPKDGEYNYLFKLLGLFFRIGFRILPASGYYYKEEEKPHLRQTFNLLQTTYVRVFGNDRESNKTADRKCNGYWDSIVFKSEGLSLRLHKVAFLLSDIRLFQAQLLQT